MGENGLDSGGMFHRYAHSSIFLGYRREDSGDVAGRVFDRLRADLGDSVAFKDAIESIRAFTKSVSELL